MTPYKIRVGSPSEDGSKFSVEILSQGEVVHVHYGRDFEQLKLVVQNKVRILNCQHQVLELFAYLLHRNEDFSQGELITLFASAIVEILNSVPDSQSKQEGLREILKLIRNGVENHVGIFGQGG